MAKTIALIGTGGVGKTRIVRGICNVFGPEARDVTKRSTKWLDVDGNTWIDTVSFDRKLYGQAVQDIAEVANVDVIVLVMRPDQSDILEWLLLILGEQRSKLMLAFTFWETLDPMECDQLKARLPSVPFIFLGELEAFRLAALNINIV
jgi:hypothetical protein